MKSKSNVLSSALSSLLNEKLPAAEEQSLKDEGFALKNPTRKAALAIAIYKKAVSGDLSAIKELCSILSSASNEDKATRMVMIVDDI